MSLVNVQLNATEPEPAPANSGYSLRVFKVDSFEAAGRTNFAATIEILNPPEDLNVPTFRHTLWMPDPDGEDWQITSSKLALQRFFSMFGVDFDEAGFDTDDLPGATANNCTLRLVYNERLEREENALVLKAVK